MLLSGSFLLEGGFTKELTVSSGGRGVKMKREE